LERRDRLQSELKLLSDMLGKMRILTAEDVDASKAGVGTVVRFKKAGSDPITYTLLGPMDSDAEKNILSFQSKLAQSMTGKRVGDKVVIHGGDWIIASITSYYDR